MEWHTLVHVCRRWRTLVFGSPHHLNLQLLCTARTPVRKKLDIWPALPLVVEKYGLPASSMDNIIAALEHKDRVIKVDLRRLEAGPELESIVGVMEEPFPALTFLSLILHGETVFVPNSFLGGPAPRLEHLHLEGIPFWGLPKLVSSTTSLVHLELRRIPYFGYILPGVLVTSLSALTRLKTFIFEFVSPHSPLANWESQYLPPTTRILLPALTCLKLKAISKYVEYVMTGIDTPLLDSLHITFFNQAIFDTPHLSQFIARTPNFQAFDEARITFSDDKVMVALPSPAGKSQFELSLGISRNDESVGHLSSLVQVCRSSFPVLATVERLYIRRDGYLRRKPWVDHIPDSHWVELLQLFTAVKSLYLSGEFVRCITLTLQGLVEELTTQVLPALQNLLLQGYRQWGPIGKATADFVTARQLSGQLISVGSWSGS